MPHDATVGLSRSRTFLPQLEALRGVAVLLVFAFHLDGRMRYFTDPPVDPSMWMGVIRAGQNGVDLFFVLSAFLLALPFLDDRPQSVRVFYARRALRILPLYYAAILCALFTARSGGLWEALPYPLFLNSLMGSNSPLPPWSEVWWSLATEAQFYVFLPLLGLARRHRAWWWVGIGVLVLWTLAYAGMTLGLLGIRSLPVMFKLTHSIVGRGPLFLWGIAAAWLYQRHGAALRARLAGLAWLRRGGADVLLVVLGLAVVVFLDWLQGLTFGQQEAPRRQLLHVGAGALWTSVLLVLVLAPLRSGGGVVGRFLGRLGVLSYSIYLLHVPVIYYVLDVVQELPEQWTLPGGGAPLASFFIGWQPATIGLAVLIATLCYGLSTLTFRFVERPFLVRKARFDVAA